MRLKPHDADTLRQYQNEYPVKVGALAKALGITVKEADMPDDVSGSLSRDNGQADKWVIRVNRRHAKVRQRFTVAHEIAHFLLHRDQIGASLTDDTFYRSSLSDKREWEANKLAADILMPTHLIRRATSDGNNHPGQLAKAFEVSEAAMSIRLGLPA